jgi:hypothetical protein
VDEEPFKIKFAQWLLTMPSDQLLRVTFEMIEN